MKTVWITKRGRRTFAASMCIRSNKLLLQYMRVTDIKQYLRELNINGKPKTRF